MRGLADKVVLVTGGGGAIGRSICRRLAEERAIVAVCDRNGEAARSVAAEIKAAGGRAEGVEFDICDYGAVERGVERIEREMGPIAILVNNAGWDRFANFLESTPDLWQQLVAINLYGPLNMHHVVLRRMAERKFGRVINIASDAARVGSSGEAVYSACKAGVVALTKTLARELANRGVTLNAVCPGPTDTPLLRSFLAEGPSGEKVALALERAIPLRRLGQPDDMCGIVAFLASDEAAFMTGQVVSVSGGLTMQG